MKRILNFSALLMFTLVLLTSCGTQKSFSDRHYNNNYYIGMSKAEKTPKIKNDKLEKITPEAEQEFVLASNTEIVTKVSTDTPAEVEVSSEEVLQPATIETADEQKETQSNHVNRTNKKSQETPFTLLEKVEKVKERISPPASSDDALSLLWIVIVIILILWLIGFALGGLGLGGAIHVLLVIALILLILWLLGII